MNADPRSKPLDAFARGRTARGRGDAGHLNPVAHMRTSHPECAASATLQKRFANAHTDCGDGQVTKREVSLVLKVPPQFLELCKRQGIEPETVLQGIITDLCALEKIEEHMVACGPSLNKAPL
jgi:hypothetical protein